MGRADVFSQPDAPVPFSSPAALHDHPVTGPPGVVPQALAVFRRNRPRRVDRSWSRANPRRCRPRAGGSPFWRPSKRQPGGTGNATLTRRTELEGKLSWWTSPHVGVAILSDRVMA
jgi:hypothetical protein